MTQALRIGLLLTLLTVTAYYAVLHARLLRIGHPITQDEPRQVEITAAGNAYTFDGVVACANVYGPGYPWWARPFTSAIANPYLAHRWASTAALLLTLGGLAWVLRREGVGGIEIAAGAAVVYALNVSSHSLVANGDLLGAGLYFAALAVSRRGTWPALVAGLVLALLATLTKPYFALAWVVVAIHLLLFAPPRRALAYLGLSALVGLAAAAVLQLMAPWYFLSTFGVQQAASLRRFATLRGQTVEFAVLAGGLMLLALLHRPRQRTLTAAWTAAPLQPAIDLWTWAALAAAAALLGSLGWHPGNYLVYYFHLLLLPLVIVALRHIAAWPNLGRALLMANLLVLGYLLPPQPGNDQWSALEASVAAVRGPILAEPLLEPFTRSRAEVELLDRGQSATVLQALDARDGRSPREEDLHRALLRQTKALNDRIRRGEFAAIYVSYQEIAGGTAWSYEIEHMRDALFARYRLAGEVIVFPYAAPYWDRLRHGTHAYHVTQWVPRPTVPNAPAGTQ